ncbi:hypothetical protein JW872_01820 [Candidatus Babeliales bacterium]|nr:hypothetical protein [Candidatus Babeliales bacterium]
MKRVHIFTMSLLSTLTLTAATDNPQEVFADIEQHEDALRAYLFNQMLVTAQKIAHAPKGQGNLEFQALTNIKIQELSQEEKEATVFELSYQTKLILVEAIVYQFLNQNNTTPLRIPRSCKLVSQWDMFCLMLQTLLDGPDLPEMSEVKTEAREILNSCIGERDILRINKKFGRLDEPRFQQLLPTAVQERFCRPSMARQLELGRLLKSRVKSFS